MVACKRRRKAAQVIASQEGVGKEKMSLEDWRIFKAQRKLLKKGAIQELSRKPASGQSGPKGKLPGSRKNKRVSSTGCGIPKPDWAKPTHPESMTGVVQLPPLDQCDYVMVLTEDGVKLRFYYVDFDPHYLPKGGDRVEFIPKWVEGKGAKVGSLVSIKGRGKRNYWVDGGLTFCRNRQSGFVTFVNPVTFEPTKANLSAKVLSKNNFSPDYPYSELGVRAKITERTPGKFSVLSLSIE